MKKINKNYVIYTLAIIFATASIIHIANANQTFVSVLEAERNVLIEEQHDIQEDAAHLKEKLSKEEERLQRQQALVNSLKGQIQEQKDQHNMNNGRIEQITRTLEVYEGL